MVSLLTELPYSNNNTIYYANKWAFSSINPLPVLDGRAYHASCFCVCVRNSDPQDESSELWTCLCKEDV